MSTDNASNQAARTREQKRARFDANQPASNAKKSAMVAAAVAAAIVIVSAFFLLEGGNTNSNVARGTNPMTAPTAPGARAGAAAAGPTSASATALAPEGDVFRIPAASITTEATFFKGTVGSATVPFFAVRDASGKVHVALDACQACAMAKKGYTQAGDAMKCRNCGMTFPVAQITEMGDKGGCHPILVPAVTSGDTIGVKASDLASGTKWF
jgi:hypothetical protein